MLKFFSKFFNRNLGSYTPLTFNQHTIFGEYTCTTSYTTGGMVIDLSKTFSSVKHLNLAIKTRGANLPLSRFEYTLDTPSAGQITVKINRKRYDRISTVGNVSGQPSGVTIQATSGVASSSESAHTHAIDHNHASFNSGTNTGNTGQVLLDAIGPLLDAHTHALDIPNLTGTSGAGTAHNHTDNSIYAHQHNITTTATELTSTELANATNLSATILYLTATGVKL